jgi:hypothetical protein
MVSQFIRLFGHYIRAIGVASVASFAIALFSTPLFWPELPDSIVMLLRVVQGVLIGFFGVFLGAFCLPSYHRRFGAFFLVLLGLSFYIFVELHDYLKNSYFDTWPSATLYARFIRGLPLAGGGLAAALTVCFWRRRPNPQGGANGRPPFGSETNRMSSAAGSRRSP